MEHSSTVPVSLVEQGELACRGPSARVALATFALLVLSHSHLHTLRTLRMPRQTRSSRPTARPAASHAGPSTQTRQASTMAAPPAHAPHHAAPPVAHAPAAPTSAGPGLFGQVSQRFAVFEDVLGWLRSIGRVGDGGGAVCGCLGSEGDLRWNKEEWRDWHVARTVAQLYEDFDEVLRMASTAAGVAVGSTVGHGLSSMLFGGGGSSTPAEAPAAPVEQQTYQQARMGGACEVQAKDFVSCLNATGNDTQSCQYYLDMLKQCQAAAAPY
ncbi:hypothetical protein RTBOTA2_002491 [Rhodotorula toruloides]|nr:hypothetical protein RTBOTA2_002491 [Rhodotorula toruloides]